MVASCLGSRSSRATPATVGNSTQPNAINVNVSASLSKYKVIRIYFDTNTRDNDAKQPLGICHTGPKMDDIFTLFRAYKKKGRLGPKGMEEQWQNYDRSAAWGSAVPEIVSTKEPMARSWRGMGSSGVHAE